MRRQGAGMQIFDVIRKRWLQLTPEEWVRQHVLNYLTSVKNYPSSSIAIEKEIVLNDTRKRFDIVVYNRQLQPLLLVECKAPYIPLDPPVMEQILRYNLVLTAALLMISNGVSDAVFNARGERIELPDYDSLHN